MPADVGGASVAPVRKLGLPSEKKKRKRMEEKGEKG